LELDPDLSSGHVESGSRFVSRLASGLERGVEVGGSGRGVIAVFRFYPAARIITLAGGEGARVAGAPDHTFSVRRRVEYRTRAADAEYRIPDGGCRPHYQHIAGHDLSGAGCFQRRQLEHNWRRPGDGSPAARPGHDPAGVVGTYQYP